MNKEEIEQLRESLLEQIERLPDEQASVLREQIENASPEQLEAFVKQMQAQAQASGGGECFFCQLVSGKVETVKIYEDADIIAILDIYPASLGHIIIIPKEHFEFMHEIPDLLLNKLFIFVKAIEPILLEITKAQGLSIHIAQGLATGQTVRHFSINIIPRFENDKLSFGWEKKKVDKEKLEDVGEKIRKKAESIMREKLEGERKKLEKEKKAEEASEAEKILRHMKKRLP